VDLNRFALKGAKTSCESVEDEFFDVKLRWSAKVFRIDGKRMAKALEADERLRES
jgi:hypothetical protein